MAYNTIVAERVREYLDHFPTINVTEKRMFGGLAFMINRKMCVNVSGDNLMCRFDPQLTELLAGKVGFKPMIMNGKSLEGYCYIEPIGFTDNGDFQYWIDLCLNFNEKIKILKKHPKD
jgi:hypothetical protein